MKILISTLTTGTRQQTLTKCLESIIKQKTSSEFNYEILVVENNIKPNSDIEQLLKKIKKNASCSVNHILETRLGIPYARNAALEYGYNRKFDALAFIDDDAFAENDWLYQLFMVKLHTHSQAITGPQKPIFPDNCPKRFVQSKAYHAREVNNNLSTVAWAATNNVLFDLHFLRNNNIRFKDDLIFGGEDKELTLRLSDCGGIITWNKNAIVNEYIAHERLKLSWILRRNFRIGATGLKIERANKSQFLSVLACLFKGSAYWIYGLLSFIPFLLLPNKTIFNSLANIAHGFGFYYGLFTGGTVKSYT